MSELQFLKDTTRANIPAMDDFQRLHLSTLIKENNVIDNTPLIRQLKHSKILRKEIDTMLKLKQDWKDGIIASEEDFKLETMIQCSTLCAYYTDVCHKIRKGDMNVQLFCRALDALEQIEEGIVDMHTAAVHFGTLMKEAFCDAVANQAERMEREDKEREDKENENKKQGDGGTQEVNMALDWKSFKKDNPLTESEKAREQECKRTNEEEVTRTQTEKQRKLELKQRMANAKAQAKARARGQI